MRRIDRQAARGLAAAGSQQIAELIAEFGLQHDEYETRRRHDEQQAATDRERARTRAPTWRHSR